MFQAGILNGASPSTQEQAGRRIIFKSLPGVRSMYQIWHPKEKCSGPAYDGVQGSLSQCFDSFFRLVYTLIKTIRHLHFVFVYSAFPVDLDI